MCGIAGFWSLAGLSSGASTTLSRMLLQIHHRGPDGSGTHLEPERGLAMGHARLSIIDLSETGRQPIVSPDKRLVLTVNGEFYDYKTLRAELACLGERFFTKTDSEVALKLYQKDGLDFVRSLRGEFALALFDEEQQRLVLVRDRFGVRPLFYHLQRDKLVWGSEVKALLEHPDVPKRLGARAALHQMMQTMVPGTSAFDGVEALQPGELMVVQRSGDRFEVRKHRYWDMNFPAQEDHDTHPDRQVYVAGVADQLIDAVRVRLEADVPVGCYLSGGIDSCSILGLSTAMQQSPVKAFTISFDHDAYDEAAIAREMAQKTRADQELLEVTAAELYGDSFTKTLWHSERTFYNTLGVAKYHMSRRVRQCGFKVVVTGEGSDEMFAGYPFFKKDYFLHAPEAGAEADGLGRKLAKSNAVFQGAILTDQVVEHPAMNDLVGFTPAWIQPWLLTLQMVRPLFSKAAQEELADYDPVAAIVDAIDARQLSGRHPLDKVQYTWIKTMLEGQILNWGGDRVDMANSMESRPPFLDHRLAEYAARIPPSVRIHGGIEKWVLREAMKGVLPEVLYRREKFAFMAPPAHTDRQKRAAVERLFEAHLGPEQIAALGLFDPDRVREAFEGYWTETDTTVAKRKDIVVNHLLGMHLLHQKLVQPAGG
jgi:asparagine synthase (glutamine-hydrolysing)